MSDTNKVILITINVTPAQLKILGEILTMKGFGFPADQGIAAGTLLELIQEKIKENPED